MLIILTIRFLSFGRFLVQVVSNMEGLMFGKIING